jgi:hypothetical protein
LRPDNCDFDEYVAWFQGGCNSIPLEPGFSIVQPEINAINNPAPPWSIAFAIIYDDGVYIRIFEHYRELSRRDGSGGRLQYLSYHYGPCGTERDEGGFPTREDNCVLRIDIDQSVTPKHAHYAGENHISEHRLKGLDFSTLTPFDFIRAVEEHRKTSKPLAAILGFEVRSEL